MDRLDELREKVLTVLRPYVKRVSVFGSFARGEQTPDSDIDLLVELKPPDECPPIGLKWYGFEQELSRMLGRDVELVSEGALSPYVRPYVEQEKIILYEER